MANDWDFPETIYAWRDSYNTENGSDIFLASPSKEDLLEGEYVGVYRLAATKRLEVVTTLKDIEED